MEIYQELILRIVISFLIVYLLDGIIELMFKKAIQGETKEKKKGNKEKNTIITSN
jgi:hypothetical protein